MSDRMCIGVRSSGKNLCWDDPSCGHCREAKWQYAREIVDRAPPLTETQRRNIRALLHPLGRSSDIPVDLVPPEFPSRPVKDAPDPDRATALYRFYDDRDRLLYVGVAYDPDVRHQQHLVSSRWAPLIARRVDTWHDTRTDARTAEAAAVRDEGPMFNTQLRKHLPKMPVEV